MGLIITFEGPDKAGGKTTQIKLLIERINKKYPEIQIIKTLQPGGTPHGVYIRKLLLTPTELSLPEDFDYLTEIFLFQADRAENWSQALKDKAENKTVIIDRHDISSFAYQGYTRLNLPQYVEDLTRMGFKTGQDLIVHLNKLSCRGVYPDLTVVFLSDPKLCLKMIDQDLERKGDRLDRESSEFHTKLIEGLYHLQKHHEEYYPGRKFAFIDVTPFYEFSKEESIAKLNDAILEIIEPIIIEHYKKTFS